MSTIIRPCEGIWSCLWGCHVCTNPSKSSISFAGICHYPPNYRLLYLGFSQCHSLNELLYSHTENGLRFLSFYFVANSYAISDYWLVDSMEWYLFTLVYVCDLKVIGCPYYCIILVKRIFCPLKFVQKNYHQTKYLTIHITNYITKYSAVTLMPWFWKLKYSMLIACNDACWWVHLFCMIILIVDSHTTFNLRQWLCYKRFLTTCCL